MNIFDINKDDGRLIIKFMGMKIFSHKLKNAGQKNYVVLVKQNGDKVINPKLKKVKVHFAGSRNIVKLYEPLDAFSSLNIGLRHNDRVEIKTSKNIIGPLNIQCNGHARVFIDENFSFVNGSIIADYASSVKIGKDCMFSGGIMIQTSDAHTIYDANKNNLISAADIEIGNHVWLGMDTKILKKSVIPDGCIVGMGAVVTKKFDVKNSVIAGCPAKIVKSDVFWDREYYWKIKSLKQENEIIKKYKTKGTDNAKEENL